MQLEIGSCALHAVGTAVLLRASLQIYKSFVVQPMRAIIEKRVGCFRS